MTVEGLRNGNGLITYTLYPDDRKRFLANGGSLQRIRVDAGYPATETCIPLPRPGAYLLAVYHDEDGDRKLDRNFIGLPKEGFAFSNNAAADFSPTILELWLEQIGLEAVKRQPQLQDHGGDERGQRLPIPVTVIYV